MRATGTAGEGDAGDQENGVKASGELLFVHIYKWLFLQHQAFYVKFCKKKIIPFKSKYLINLFSKDAFKLINRMISEGSCD